MRCWLLSLRLVQWAWFNRQQCGVLGPAGLQGASLSSCCLNRGRVINCEGCCGANNHLTYDNIGHDHPACDPWTQGRRDRERECMRVCALVCVFVCACMHVSYSTSIFTLCVCGYRASPTTHHFNIAHDFDAHMVEACGTITCSAHTLPTPCPCPVQPTP